MKAQLAPLDIAVISLVLFVGLLLLALIPAHLVTRNLAITTKITYTSNEADLTLLTLLSTSYNGRTLYSVFSASPFEIKSENFKNFFTSQLNKTLAYKLKCYSLIVDKEELKLGGCSSYDYRAAYPIFKPYNPAGLIGKVELAYQKVS